MCVIMPKHGERHDLKVGMMKTNGGVTPMIPCSKTKILKIILISDPLAAIIFARLRGKNTAKAIQIPEMIPFQSLINKYLHISHMHDHKPK